ncbi:mannitol dehydrogenase family protein [soil metagenome]
MTEPLALPDYSRSDLAVGIVHFGVGNFHRSHQAMYLDRLFTLGLARDWAICGVGVLPGDVRMRDALEAQGMRYTLVERYPDGSAPARTIGSIAEYLFAPEDPEAVVEKLADPAVRIVSLTITEGGYNTDELTGEFDLAQPDVAADLAGGGPPRTVFGFVAEGARRRRERGIPPFTVMSCDNLQGNGHVAQGSFFAFARAKDAELGDWMEREVAFPNSMVDRITPVTGEEERAFVRDSYGVDDAWPVVSEGFVQWVLEDRFPAGRPPYERVGVQLVDDVVPYEKMKLRLLNASHQAIAYVGYLSGHRFVHEAASDPLIAAFVTDYMHREGEPTLGTVPGVDLPEYERSLMDRFANPYVRDTLLRLATDGSDRIAKFVLPVARDRIAAGESVGLCAMIAASWAVFALGTDEQGAAIPVSDRQAEIVADALARAGDDPAALAADPRLFADLASQPAFIEAFARAHRAIRDRGVRDALAGRDVALHHE